MTSRSKNIDEIQYERIQNMNKEKTYEELEDYENNYELKVSLVNIDSRFRNFNPKNITDGKPFFLSNNPLTTTENSYEIKILYPNHHFKLGDKFIIQNIDVEHLIIKERFYLFNGFKYLLINIDNHNYNNIILHNEIENKINIVNYEQIDQAKRLIGNIPINSILGYRKIFTYNEIIIENVILNDILQYFNINEQTLDNNYIFIELPFPYSKTNKLNNNIIFTDSYQLENIFEIIDSNIGGIPIKYLNANYPINNKQYKSCHFISKTDQNYIYFNSDVKANFSESGGLNKVYLSKITNVIEGYTKSDNYVIDLKKSFTDVVRIELVSTEIPFVEFNVSNNISNKNNKLYWKYLDDGDVIYSTTIDEGSYGPNTLINKIKERLNLVERIGSTNKNKIFNLFDIEVDKNSQEVKFLSYKLERLPNSLKIIKDNILTNSFKLEITCPNNYVKVNDKITISDSNAIGDISKNIINGDHIVYEVNPQNDTFSIIIPVDLTIQNLNIEGTGGAYVKVKVPVLASFLFNFSDTMGKILGFKNVGDQLSYTNFSHITSNFDNYVEETLFDEVGNKDLYNPLLNLTGTNFYLMMYVNDFENIISNTSSDNPFAKILLSGYPGDIMFNTFISSPLEFDIPVSVINELKVSFRYADNSSPNFKNFDHSFTLRITERMTKSNRTQILSNKKDYKQSMIELHTLDRD